jgi:hypothetical protein
MFRSRECSNRHSADLPRFLLRSWNYLCRFARRYDRTLDFFKVPKREKTEVLAAFAAHKGEVTAGYVEVPKQD